ncbi:VWA domain-containing protein [Patescibacteria group bacterium]
MSDNKVNLAKKQFVSLKKKAAEKVALTGLNGQRAQVVGVLDISGSMSGLYRNGAVQAICEKGLALGIQFDDDGEIPVYPFGVNVHPARTLTEQDFYGFVDREITMKLEYGTNYAKPLELIIQDLFPGAKRTQTQQKKKGGLFGFGGGAKTVEGNFEQLAATNNPVFVQFWTDGDCGDKARAEEIIRAAATLPMFIQFIGIGRDSFGFLKKLDDLANRFVDNAGFVQFPNIESITDEDFLAGMLNEFPDWIKEARTKGLVI